MNETRTVTYLSHLGVAQWLLAAGGQCVGLFASSRSGTDYQTAQFVVRAKSHSTPGSYTYPYAKVQGTTITDTVEDAQIAQVESRGKRAGRS